MKKVKIGVIGNGIIGEHHLNLYQSIPEAEVVALCDINEARMNEMGTAIAKLKPGVFSEKIWSLDRRLYRAEYDALENDG